MMDAGAVVETVRIGTASLSRMAGSPEAADGFSMQGKAPLLFVVVTNAGEAPQLTVHFDTGEGDTPDERWARIKRIVAKREGVPVPA